MIFPKSWWRLTWLWLFKGGYVQESSSNQIKRPLSVGSIRIAVIALSLGICALSLTFAVFSGFQQLLSHAVIKNNGHLRYAASDWLNYSVLPASLEELPVAVERMQLYWPAPVMVLGKKSGRGVSVEVRRDYNSLVNPVASELKDKAPEFIPASMSKSLASILGLNQGDEFKVVIPGYLKKAIPLKLTSFEGVGIHHVDTRRMIISEAELLDYIRIKHPSVYERRLGDFRGIRFFLNDEKTSMFSLPVLFNKARKLESYFESKTQDSIARVSTWKDEQHNFFGGIANDKRLVSVVMAMLTIVAALNVATSLLVLFFEKDRQIALIRALGMSKRQLQWWTSIQGLLMGVVASIFGFALSGVLSIVLPKLPFLSLPKDVYNVTQIPIRFVPSEQFLVLAFGVLSALFVSLILGFMLSRMSIVKVLGHRR